MRTMSLVIVEDETGASEHLINLLREYDSDLEIKAVLRSVEESVGWFESNPHPGLGIFDIQLGDGTSFDIFDRTPLTFPIIFTTAFNQYAIKAFRVNSVDYLLKPVKSGELHRALNKLASTQTLSAINYAALAKEIAGVNTRRIFTLLVSQREKLIPIPSDDFACFFIRNGLPHGHASGRSHPLMGITMDELEGRLDPVTFFRVNRQCIVNRNAIVHMEPHFHSKLILRLNIPEQESFIVSKARTSLFKKWLSTGSH